MDIQEFIRKDVLENIENYNSRMSISKVVMFFERHQIFFTKTMIQNYTRIELLPKLENKRYYSKKHLVFLALIDALKGTYPLEVLKALFIPLYGLEEAFDVKRLLTTFNAVYNNTIKEQVKQMADIQRKMQQESDDPTAVTALALIHWMAQSIAVKELVVRAIESN